MTQMVRTEVAQARRPVNAREIAPLPSPPARAIGALPTARGPRCRPSADANAQVAQLVEHATENRSVGGSIPPLGTISPFANVRRRLKNPRNGFSLKMPSVQVCTT